MSTLRYAELFAGAGGLSLGLEMAGWSPVAHAEIEPHARAVLREHWPDCRLDGDVTAINGADYAGVTLLSGGSPCQDLSVAGKRAGMVEDSGTRSSLYFEQVRIWRETGAPYFLWENVLGAFSSNNGRDFAAVLSALVGAAVPVPDDGWRGAGVASGPAGVAAWRVLDCRFFGPPQRRRRVFVLCARAGGVDPAEVLALSEGVRGDTPARGQARERPAADAGGGAGGAIAFQPGNLIRRAGAEPSEVAFPTRGSETQGDQSAHVLATNNDIRAAVTGAAAPLRGGGGRAQSAVCAIGGTVAHALTGNGCDASEDGTGRGTPVVVVAIDMRSATRTTETSEQNRQGPGIGDENAASPTLTGMFVPAVVVAFDTTQVTSAANRSNPQPGDPCHPLAAGAHAPCITMTFVERGRADGRSVETRTDGVINTLMTPNGGRGGTGMGDGILTYDERGNGDGLTANTMAGDHQNRVTDYTAIILRNREGKPGGGKGPLLSAERERTIGTGNDQVLFTLASGQANAEIVRDGAPTLNNNHDGAPIAFQGVGIPRRLMPVECERLMGWGDGWTQYGVAEDGTRYALSDTARYRLVGNGVSSPVAAWIAWRLRWAIESAETAP